MSTLTISIKENELLHKALNFMLVKADAVKKCSTNIALYVYYKQLNEQISDLITKVYSVENITLSTKETRLLLVAINELNKEISLEPHNKQIIQNLAIKLVTTIHSITDYNRTVLINESHIYN